MLRAVLVLVLAVTIVEGSPRIHKPDPTCSTDQAKACLDSYFASYGFPAGQLPSYTDYVAKIIDLTTHFGANGVDVFCSLEVTLENCMGDQFNSPCMTASAFQQMYGTDIFDAFEFAADLQMRAYMCNNKQFMKDNLSCFNDVDTKYADERRKCAADVINAIANVADGDYCTPWSNFVTCTDDVYVKHCGDNVKGFICTIMETGINFDSESVCNGSMPKCG